MVGIKVPGVTVGRSTSVIGLRLTFPVVETLSSLILVLKVSLFVIPVFLTLQNTFI